MPPNVTARTALGVRYRPHAPLSQSVWTSWPRWLIALPLAELFVFSALGLILALV